MYWGRGKASERISINFVIELNVNRDFLAYLIDIQRRRGKGEGGSSRISIFVFPIGFIMF